MSKDEMLALFLLAGITVVAADRLENNYWPNVPEYCERRAKSPWWLVQTPSGLVKIGWRKRVIEIDWSRTAIRGSVTKDAVTQEDTLVHAWGYAKAVEYLDAWDRLAQRAKWRAEHPEPEPVSL